MVCISCGKEIASSSAYCNYCGKPVHAEGQASERQQGERAEKPQTKAEARFGIKLGGVLLALIGLGNLVRAWDMGGRVYDQGERLGIYLAAVVGCALLVAVGYGLFQQRKWAYWAFLCVVLPLSLVGPLWSFLLYVAFSVYLYKLRTTLT